MIVDKSGRKNPSLELGVINKAIYNEYPNRCLYCDLPILATTLDSLNEVKKKIFCNSSCFAKKNNPTRKTKDYLCKFCKEIISKTWTPRKTCNKCYGNFRSADNQTIRESSHSKIRCHARQITKKREQVCVNCGYAKFVETCHIKAIKDFDKNTKLIIVNDPKNLILLCPNCHWEFDHGLLQLAMVA